MRWTFHVVKSVEPLDDCKLKIEFNNGKIVEYDVNKMIERYNAFDALKDEELFKQVKVDAGGYGISWNDNIDLFCNDLYHEGTQLK